MKSTMKKVLCVAIVLIMTLSLMAIPVSADAYSEASDGDLLYDVNFKGTANVFTDVGDVYDGMRETVSEDGKSIDLKIDASKIPSESGAVFGGEMKAFTTPGKSYTVVFTVTAEDENQSVGIFLKWKDGFVVTPGQNAYSLGHVHNTPKNNCCSEIGADYYGINGTYDGSGELTQTYAIEFASGATAGNNGKYECTAYNLYAVVDGEWVLACALDADARQQIAWNTGDYEFMVHLARISESANDNTGKVTVSDMSVYKGLALTNDLLDAPGADEPTDDPTDDPTADPDNAQDGDLLYTVNFAGDDVFKGPKGAWSGAKATANATSVTMSTKSDANGTRRGSVWGADLNGYTILGKSYTTVFTVEASDVNEEIGFLPDDFAGFVVTPGQNSYRFMTTRYDGGKSEGAYENVITSGTYGGGKSLKQTYAVEIKVSGTQDAPSIDAYNLYVAQGGEWVLVCALTDAQMDESYFDWFYMENGVYEEDFTMRFYRRCYVLDSESWATDELDSTQDGTVTVSDAKVYKGLAVTEELIEAPATSVVAPVEPDGGNTDGGNTDGGNTDGGNTDGGNTDGGNTDGGNTDGGNTDGGNTDGGNTDNGGSNNGDNTANDPFNDGKTDDGKTDDGANDDADAPATSDTEAETEAKKGGCGGSVAMSGVALVGACAAMLAIKRRKNEDD